jgi:choline transporter-like protein 2/4/5
MYKFADDWKSEVPQTHSQRQLWAAKGLGITFCVLCALWLCMLVFLRKRINLAIGLVREAARAVIAMPAMMAYPFLQALGLLAFLVPWCIFSVSVATLGRFEPRQFTGMNIDPLNLNPVIVVQRFQYGSEGSVYAWYMLFVLLWTAQFIVAVGQITLALAVSTWYFTREKGRIGSGTLCRAIAITSQYHLGTAAFGSLIIAIVEFIRAVVAWLQKKVRDEGVLGVFDM